MLLFAVCILAITLLLYLRTRNGLAAWANLSIPPREASELIMATKVGWFGAVPALAIVLLGFALEILKAMKKMAVKSEIPGISPMAQT